MRPKKRFRRGDRGHRISAKRRAVLIAARVARCGKENVSPTIPAPREQVPSAAEVPTPSLLQQDHDVQQCSIDGCRIVNVAELAKAIYELTAHSATCGGACFIEGETNAGLAVVFSAACSKCDACYSIRSSHQITTSDGKKRWAVNMAAVLGQMSTGGGHARLNSILGILDIPGMSKRMFSSTEHFLGDEMKVRLLETMAQAAVEERQHAIEVNDYHQGVPAISVVADAGWSKRTHKHSYNAKSGVAVIFGAHTKKLLFMGVRNKYCSICAVAEHKKQKPPQHHCYCNWDGSSVAMESDIISEGFRLSESMYGLRYMRVVGDGDSSVMATIVQTVPYGMFVEKIECANHACKAYRSRLEELAKDHPQYRGKGGLTKRVIQWLTVGARITIQMHSTSRNVQQLRHDLRNGPAHVFGDHCQCNPQFCQHSAMKENSSEDNQTCDVIQTPASSFREQIEAIIMEEEEIAAEPSAEEVADARRGHTGPLSSLPEGLFAKVMACGDRLVMLAPRLITNQTSNLAEYYMSIQCCFDGGKQYNRIQRGSFQARCYAAGLRVQNGTKWVTDFWEKSTGEKPGEVILLVSKIRLCQGHQYHS